MKLTRRWIAGTLGIFLGVTLAMGAPAGVLAQQNTEPAEATIKDPPEILTSDMGLRTALESDRLTVNFVVVDSDNIVSVTINGEAQEFEPADTVMITREFHFTQPQTVVEVRATDEAGNSKTVRYTAFLPGVDIEKSRKGRELTYAFHYRLFRRADSNPSRDIGAPIDIEGVNVGVYSPSRQKDMSTQMLLLANFAYGPYQALLGQGSLRFGKESFQNLNSEVNFFGLGYGKVQPESAGFEFRYLFMDINLYENQTNKAPQQGDYALHHILSPAWVIRGKIDDGGSRTDTFKLEYTSKDFANSSQQDTGVYSLKWDKKTVDAEEEDTFLMRTALGIESEGILSGDKDISAYRYIGFDFDWKNTWGFGLLLDTGFGLQYRSYPNTTGVLTEQFFGLTRVDVPLRFSFATGYQFAKTLKVLFDYKYLFNLSNDRPYYRQTYGVGLQGTF